jgi:hypothetical protein
LTAVTAFTSILKEYCFDGGQSDNMLGYVDANFAGDLDDRKSPLNYVFIMGGG